MLLAISLPMAVPSLRAQIVNRSFNDDKPGVAPPGFVLAAVRQPAPGSWLIRRQGTQGHLVHQATGTAGYALALADERLEGDIEIWARIRLAAGDRTGGLVWRYVDEQNFYAVLLDVARGELAMYRFTGGNRIRIEFEDDLELDREAWHTVKVICTGRSVRVQLGGIRVFEDDDRRSSATFAPGRAGFITTGTSETWFDDFHLATRSEGRKR